MTSRRDAKKTQQDFFANMQALFLGESTNGAEGGEGIVPQLKAAADDLRAAADMMRQNTMAQPTYGGPNGSRPTFNGDGTHRPAPNGDYGQGYAGYGALRRSLATEAAARYGSTGGIFQRGNTFRAHYDSHGGISYYDEVDRSGKVVATHSKKSEEAQQIFARQQRAQGIAQMGATPNPFTTTGPGGAVHTPGVTTAQSIVNNTIGKIPVVGGIAAGLIGGLIGMPDAIMNGIVNQRAKNAQYQAILGGDNWSTGVHNRWLEEGFKLSQLYSGGLTGDQSVEAFRGITSLGYTGNARDSALGAITSNYKNLGMSVGDSLKFVSIMAQSSSTSFESLKTILNEVGLAAQNTGQNLELARANLANLFNISTNAIGGQGALQTSGYLGAFQSQLGRNFAGVDFSGMLPGVNPGLTALQASSVGMSMSDYEMIQAGGGQQARSLQARAGNNLLAMSVAPTVGIVQPIINQLIQKHGGMKSITATNDSFQSFVQAVMRDPQFIHSGVNIMALKAQIKAYTGATMNDQQAIEWLIRQSTGAGASFQAVDKQQKQAMMQSRSTENTLPASALHGTPTRGGGGGFNPAAMHDGSTGVGDGQSHVVVHDPILDRFKHYANQDYHVIVQTANGPKVVSGQYAFENMQDQIAKGTAKFIGGTFDGRSVKDVVGGGYAESNYQGKNTYHASGTDTSHFHSIKDFEKQNADKVNGNGGKVIIAPNPALAQLLSITATGNVTVANEGAQWGYVPKPSQVGVNLGP